MDNLLPKRLKTLDIARGIASLCIVIWHWQHFFLVAGAYPKTFDRSTQPFYGLLYPIYHWGGDQVVNFFFVLSGFIFFWLYQQPISGKVCKLSEFITLRFARLYPLHVTTLVAMALLQFTYIKQTGSFFVYGANDNAYHFILNLFFISSWGFEESPSFNGPAWSVSTEIGLYLIFFFLAYFKQTSTLKLLSIVTIALLIQSAGHGGRWSFAVESFFIGSLTYKFLQWYLIRKTSGRTFFVTIFTVLFWTAAIFSSNLAKFIFESSHLYLVLLYPSTILSLALLELRVPSLGSRFTWIGDISYSTYLLHTPLQLVAVLIIRSLGFDTTIFLSPLSLPLFFLILIPLAAVSYCYLEKPLQKIIRNHYFSAKRP